MKIRTATALIAILSGPALAEENRQLEAHEHGVGQLDIAFEGTQIAMELHAPGADIVGFEYAPKSAEDRASVDAAVATLASPLTLFGLPEAAGCSVVQASAELEASDAHDDHDEHDDEHADHDDHGDEHADHDDHDDHGDEHADHDDHEDEHGDKHAEHEDEAGHTEFHAEYLLNCADPKAVTQIAFAYFETFPNALEVEVQIISATGATAYEVERDAPLLDLQGLF